MQTRAIDGAECNFTQQVIDGWADKTPDATALLWIDADGVSTAISFQAMARRAAQAARVLHDAGVRRGDRVLVLLGREQPWWEIMLACLKLGAIASPGTTQLVAGDIAYRLVAARAVAVITNLAMAQRVEEACALAERAPVKILLGERSGWLAYEALAGSAEPLTAHVDTRADEDALGYFTSGTTGYPKLAVHRQDYYLGHRATGQAWLGLGPGDYCWNLSDTGWAKAAWSSLFAPWLQGAAIVAHNRPGFDVAATLEILTRYPVTTICAPPTAYRMLVAADPSDLVFPTLRQCVAAGEPLGPDIIERWREATGLTIREGYGQTETTLLCANFVSAQVRPGSMGLPTPGLRLAVIDETGREATADVEGDIALDVGAGRPLGLFARYDDATAQTASTRRDHWYLTGDRGWRDADGYFWFVSRSDDVILSSGYRIGPFEVESAINSHPSVLESAVVASPDETRGEVVKAFIVLAPGVVAEAALVKALQDHVKAVTAPYKYPRRIEFVQDLPKTISGKILRRHLRAREWPSPA